ncbi:MAG: CPBP family intramembrane glutamic endopeptidase [Pseudomonadota bacterium]|nr:MAG: CPBP family intramembrane metalloprotease [Pseudomonadota bacterium]
MDAYRTDESRARLLPEGSGPLDDLALTLPVFLGYHLGVIFLPVRNAADLVTHRLVAFSEYSVVGYAALTIMIGLGYAGALLVLGREQQLRGERFAFVLLEGVVYAVSMRLIAGYVVGRLSLAAVGAEVTWFSGLITSLGAGFYEELVFRVLLFGIGVRVVRRVLGARRGLSALVVTPGWAVVAAGVFSAWHYVGEFGDAFDPRSFVFRWVCGVVFTVIYALRGFAPAVWTHALYDIWVLVLPELGASSVD